MNERRLQSVLGDYILRIPDYQRGYAWEEKQWNDFVEDIDALVDDSLQSHYTGTIVLYMPRNVQDREFKQYGRRDRYPVAEVIDGQQRLTSISLYLAAISRRLTLLGEDCHEEQDKYLYKSGQPRLELNSEQSRDIYYELITTGKSDLPTNTSHQNRIVEAYNHFDNHIKECDKERLEQLLCAITNKMHFSSYVIDDHSEVGMTFELMNSRGKDLTHLELLKNYLMYWTNRNADEDQKGSIIKSINLTWKNVYNNLQRQNEEFQCLRIAWILLCSYAPKEWDGYNGFKRDDIIPIRHFTESRTKADVIDFIYEFNAVLSSVSKFYSEVISNDQPSPQQAKWLSKIKRAGNIANFLPLIVVAKMHLEAGRIIETDYINLLKSIETYSYRVFLWQGRRSNSGLTNFFRWSYELYSADNVGRRLLSIIDSINQLTTYYISEKDFVEDCNKVQPWYTPAHKRVLKYTLFEYELYLLESQCKGQSPRIDWDQIQDSTLEHILPQTPAAGSQWRAKWSDEDREKYVHDIGNIVLTFDNSRYLNFEFDVKRGAAGSGYCYANSNIRQERKIAEFTDWTVEECKRRKEQLTEWICSRWGIADSKFNVTICIDEEE